MLYKQAKILANMNLSKSLNRTEHGNDLIHIVYKE